MSAVFGKVLKSLSKFWRVRENLEGLGAFGTVPEGLSSFGRSLNEVRTIYERFGAFGRVLECLGKYWSVRERFGAFGRVLEHLVDF